MVCEFGGVLGGAFPEADGGVAGGGDDVAVGGEGDGSDLGAISYWGAWGRGPLRVEAVVMGADGVGMDVRRLRGRVEMLIA